jgi:hypothetical protein
MYGKFPMFFRNVEDDRTSGDSKYATRHCGSRAVAWARHHLMPYHLSVEVLLDDKIGLRLAGPDGTNASMSRAGRGYPVNSTLGLRWQSAQRKFKSVQHF